MMHFFTVPILRFLLAGGPQTRRDPPLTGRAAEHLNHSARPGNTAQLMPPPLPAVGDFACEQLGSKALAARHPAWSLAGSP
jgi:hypothetical protein